MARLMISFFINIEFSWENNIFLLLGFYTQELKREIGENCKSIQESRLYHSVGHFPGSSHISSVHKKTSGVKYLKKISQKNQV